MAIDIKKIKSELLIVFRDAVSEARGEEGSRTNHNGQYDFEELAKAESNMAQLAQAYVAAAKEERKTNSEDIIAKASDTISALDEIESELATRIISARTSLSMACKPENAARARSNIAELTQTLIAVEKELRKTKVVQDQRRSEPIQAAVDTEPPPVRRASLSYSQHGPAH